MERNVKQVLSGVGFYGTLAVCLAVVGVCGWVLLRGEGTEPVQELPVTPQAAVSQPVTAVRQMAAVSTPMMLFLLGAFFRFDALSRYRKQVVLGASMKLLVMPAIFLTLGYCLGFRGMEFAALLGVFATSTAVSSFAMTRQLGGDVELSGALIVVTSTLCPFTLFLWCFLFKSLGAF